LIIYTIGMKRTITLIVFTALSAFCVFGQNFKYLRPQEGLKDGEINSIAQDKNGVMWFATWSGLVSYDGYNFKYFRPELGNPQSLSDKKVKKILYDSAGNLWIATSKELCLMDNRMLSFKTIPFERGNASPINILHLSEVDGFVIIHSVEGFYFLPVSKPGEIDFKANKLQIFQDGQLSPLYFQYSTPVGKELFLVSTTTSPVKSRIFTSEFKFDSNDTVLNIHPVTSTETEINSIEYVKPEHTIYISTVNGLIPFSLETKSFVKNTYFENVNIREAIYTSNYRLYCTTLYPVLLYIDLHTGKTGEYTANQNGGLLNNNIHSLFEDFSGNLWIGHQGQGVSILNLNQKEFKTVRRNPSLKNTLTSNTIMCFSGTDKEILIGCRTGGLNIMKRGLDDENSQEFEILNFNQNPEQVSFKDGIWDIKKESDSVFWAGTSEGLIRVYKIKNKWGFEPYEKRLFKEEVLKIFIDKNKNLWCGTLGYGLLFIPALESNPARKYYQFRSDPGNKETISDDVVKEIQLDSKGRFWIGTNNGLNQLKIKYENLDLSGENIPEMLFRRHVAVVPDENYLNNNEINCIFENFDGNLWIATTGGGINILNPETEKFSHLTTTEGLPSNDIFGIMPDEMGNLWISTINGLVSYNQFKKDPVFSIYNAYDGIQGEIFMVNSYFKAMDGEMFFGGDNGFTHFYPSAIKANKVKPRIYLTDLKIQNRQIRIGEIIRGENVLEKCLNEAGKIIIPFHRNTFSIGVASVHYQYPEGNYISYFLEGTDEKWKTIPASSRFIDFANIPFGKYTLQVKAISSDKVESESIKSLDIEVLPPWYRTWYFSLILLLIAFAVIFGFIFIIINRQRLIYQKKIDTITIENNESKMLFLTNIAHELRTPLSLVIAPIEDMMQNYTKIDPQWKNHLNLINRNSNYLLKLINQIIDFRKLNAGRLKLNPHNTDVVRLIKDVVLNFKSYEGKQKISMNLEVPAEEVMISIDAQKIEEVMYNLISNAFKNTSENHSITVSLQVLPPADGNNGELKITVFNEGKDISDSDKIKIFERFYKIDERTDGAGIGLSFSKSLVEMHGGTIEVESVPNRGVAFHVYLPFNEIGSEEIENTNASTHLEYELDEKPKSIADEIQENSLKVVIVEDNSELRAFLKNILSRNYQCFDAADGIEGLQLAKDIAPDIIISDVIMPRMDGFQLCKLIKENLKTCHIPVILLTAKNAEDQVILGYEVGADAYITKPFDINLIITQISQLIKNRELIREKYLTQNFMVEVVKTNPSKDDKFIINVRSLLEANLSDPEFNVKKMSKHLNISSTQLYRKIKVLTGYSPVEFMRIIKLQKAYSLLNLRNNTVKEICYLSGFNNLSYFIKCFREHFGVTPANFRDYGLSEHKNEDGKNNSQLTEITRN